MALHIAYTQYKRHQSDKVVFPVACNAIFGDLEDHANGLPAYQFAEKKEVVHKVKSISGNASSDEEDNNNDALILTSGKVYNSVTVSSSVAILPQYITLAPIKLTIHELSLPNLSSNFSVTSSNSPFSVSIHRSRPSLTSRQVIYDTTSTSSTSTSKPLLTIRRLRGHLPISHEILDPKENIICEIQGNFNIPFTGKHATAIMGNACNGQQVKLSMQTSLYNRKAVIMNEATGKLLASMSSEVFNLRNLVGGRRTYEILVEPGMDIVLVIAMVMSIDGRAD